MQVQAAQNYSFAEEIGTLADMDAGKDSGDTLQTNEVGEVAKVEIGAPSKGVYSEYELVSLGGIPDAQLRTKKARVDADLQNGSDADVPASTKMRLRITDKRRSTTYASTRWFDKSEVEASSVENLPVLKWAGWQEAKFAKEGRIIVMEVRNPSSSFNVEESNSTLEFPFIGAY